MILPPKTICGRHDGKQDKLLEIKLSSNFDLSYELASEMRSFSRQNICCTTRLLEFTAERMICINNSKRSKEKVSKGSKTSRSSGRWIKTWTLHIASILPYRKTNWHIVFHAFLFIYWKWRGNHFSLHVMYVNVANCKIHVVWNYAFERSWL